MTSNGAVVLGVGGLLAAAGAAGAAGAGSGSGTGGGSGASLQGFGLFLVNVVEQLIEYGLGIFVGFEGKFGFLSM